MRSEVQPDPYRQGRPRRIQPRVLRFRSGATYRAPFRRRVPPSFPSQGAGFLRGLAATLLLTGFAGPVLRTAAAGDSAAFLPPGSTVVLLSGLPGDLESETAYREQLDGWLELVGGAGERQRTIVLCDNPEALKPSESSSIQVLKANRTNFLNVGSLLKGSPNPVVMIAWGHGGRQGTTPVFHVRGPRLTPEDFKSVAAQAGARDLRCVLLFRGSGAFGSELAAAGRRIVSSESGTMFTSDPIGMPLLLKLVRAQPDIPFDQLTESFGRATAAWYKERNLARTEEPTLWNATDKPRLLAGSAEREAGGETGQQDSEVTPKARAAGPPAEHAPAIEDLPKDLPAAWKDLKRVEPQNYPDADGVMLRRKLSYTLAARPAIAMEQDEFIQILTPEGKHFGDFDVSFSPPEEEITFLDCEVVTDEGKLLRLDPDAIREAREESVGDYQAGQRKFFSLPGVAPGAVLHVRYRTEWKKFPLPHISLAVPVAFELPVREAVIQVSVPREAAFHFVFDQINAPDPVIDQSNYGTTYLWRFKDLPAYRTEVLSPPREQPRLMLSTFPGWREFAAWYGRISQLTDEVTPEIQAKAAELSRDLKTEREKVVALYNYVTRLRYVAVPLGVNSFRPHAAANVLQNQYGDCKDKANLFNALLRTLNLEGRLVLVPRFSQAHDAVPGLAFNHAISRVTLAGQPVWVDTTDDVCRFGLLPPGDPGRKVLVIDGATTALTQLPAPEAKDHLLRLHALIDCAKASGGVAVSFDLLALGYPDYELREAAREAKEHGASVPLLAARFRPVAGFFALEQQKATPVSALDEDFAWSGEGTWFGLSAATRDQGQLRSPFWLPKQWDLVLHHRRTPLFLNQGYPLTLEEEMDFKLPPGSRTGALPELRENTQAPLRWRVEWAKVGDGRLAARLRVELAKGELTMPETSLAQQQLRELIAAVAAGATFAIAQDR